MGYHLPPHPTLAEDIEVPVHTCEPSPLSNEIWPNLQAAILGEMTPQEALDKAAAAAREVMEDAGYL